MKLVLWLLLASHLVFVLVQVLRPYAEPAQEPLAFTPQGETLQLLSELEQDESPPEKAVAKVVQEVDESALIAAIEADLPETETPLSAPAEIPAVESEALTEPLRQCFTLGPFANPDQLNNAAQQFQQAGLAASSRALEEQEYMGTLVYLGGFQSRASAELIGERLKSKQVKDFLVVYEPKKDFAISLGVFREAAYVERRQALMRQLGYQPETEARYRKRTLYWLDYEQQDAEKERSLLDWIGSQQNAVKKLQRSCS